MRRDIGKGVGGRGGGRRGGGWGLFLAGNFKIGHFFHFPVTLKLIFSPNKGVVVTIVVYMVRVILVLFDICQELCYSCN